MPEVITDTYIQMTSKRQKNFCDCTRIIGFLPAFGSPHIPVNFEAIIVYCPCRPNVAIDPLSPIDAVRRMYLIVPVRTKGTITEFGSA